MRKISTMTHGLVDYVTAAKLPGLASALGFSARVAGILTGVGAMVGLGSFLTRYEAGVVRMIPMKGHLVIDGATGAALLAAAGIMDDERPAARATLAGLGLLFIASALLTEHHPRAGGIRPIQHQMATYPPGESDPELARTALEQEMSAYGAAV